MTRSSIGVAIVAGLIRSGHLVAGLPAMPRGCCPGGGGGNVAVQRVSDRVGV